MRSQGLIDLWLMRDPRVGGWAQKELRRRKLEYSLEEAAIRVVASEPDAEGLKLIVRRLPGASAALFGRALRLVRGVRDPGALEVLRRAAGHRSPRVRTFVAEILGGIPSLENAAALVAALKSERDEQVRSAQAEALGDMGSRVAIPVLLAQSDRVCFVIDASGSMADKDGDVSRFDKAKSQVREALKRMAAAAQVNVVFFDDKVRAWRKSLAPLTPANRKSLAKYIDDRAVGDRTNLFDALRLALSRRDVDTIFVLSDGAPTVGEFQSSRDVLRAIRRLNRTRNIAIHGVAIGVDSTLLRLLAEEHGGKYVRR